jgi:hypothetical protein
MVNLNVIIQVFMNSHYIKGVQDCGDDFFHYHGNELSSS